MPRPQLDHTIFLAHVDAKPLKGGLWAPQVTVIQQSRSVYRTLSLDMGNELFHTQTAAVEYGIEHTREELNKQYHDPEVRFIRRNSGKEGKT